MCSRGAVWQAFRAAVAAKLSGCSDAKVLELARAHLPVPQDKLGRALRLPDNLSKHLYERVGRTAIDVANLITQEVEEDESD